MHMKILIEMFFSPKKDSNTRGHEVKLVKDQYRQDIWKYSFSQRTINERNRLFTDCVTASSVNMLTHISGGRVTRRTLLDSR